MKSWTPKWFGRAIFGYDLKADTWYGCGSGQWFAIPGDWPDMEYQTIETESMTFRVVSCLDLARLGIEGTSLPARPPCAGTRSIEHAGTR